MTEPGGDWRTAGPQSPGPLRIRRLGKVRYRSSLRAMQVYSDRRTAGSADSIWLLQHPSTYTLGVGAPTDHVLDSGDCPVIRSDRGGKATWHGNGQLVGYLLLDLQRLGLNVRALVRRTEAMLVELLRGYGLEDAEARPGRPGVWLADGKVASLGFRIRRRRCYHGFSLNVDCDLEPFRRIYPCGVAGLPVCRMADRVPGIAVGAVCERLEPLLRRYFGGDG